MRFQARKRSQIVPLKSLFLSHQHGAAAEIAELATELQIRGVVPWVDKRRGGFRVARESVTEARRVIREDCFGLLLYATDEAFESDFIRDVEIDEAKRTREEAPSYLLFPFARDMGFGRLKTQSLATFEIDLAAYHGVAVGAKDASPGIVRTKQIEAAQLVLDEVLARSVVPGQPTVSLQISTRDLFPDSDDDALRVDATSLFRDRVDDPDVWSRLLCGLLDIKDRLARTGARPRLYIHGSKHLTAAFMIGRVFSPFQLDIRQTDDDIWSSDTPFPSWANPLEVTMENGHNSGPLFVGIASRNKDVASGIDAFVAQRNLQLPTRLILAPPNGPLNVDNELCRAMVHQAYAEIERAMRGSQYSAIHLFVAAPQSFMMLLGREFKGMPPVHLHEWTGVGYLETCLVPGNVL
jgi:hypothetical protein